MSKGELPVFRISAGTAFKAGFFGALGFLVGQAVIVGVAGIVFIGLLGISISSLRGNGPRGTGVEAPSSPAHVSAAEPATARPQALADATPGRPGRAGTASTR